MQTQINAFLATLKTYTQKAKSLAFPIQRPQVTHMIWQTSLIHFDQHLWLNGNEDEWYEPLECTFFVQTTMKLLWQTLYALALIILI